MTTQFRKLGAAGIAVAVCGLGFNACSVIRAAKRVASAVEGNKATIDSFTKNLSSGATTFEATYVTTGTTPATIVYAVKPPRGLLFTETPTGRANATATIDIIVNSSGEYSCTDGVAGGAATCQRLGTGTAATENSIFSFYTPSHWTAFLKDFSLTAGIAGDKVTTSSMTVNGFSMQCVDFRATGVPGTSTICTTAQGILGYVQVASDTTGFEIKSYTPTPPNSLFALPTGATVTPPGSGTN